MKIDSQFLYSVINTRCFAYVLIILFSALILISWTSWFFLQTHKLNIALDYQSPKKLIKKETTNYVLSAPIFGVYVPQDVNAKSIKKSLLNVSLVGILLANKTEDSQVIIRTENGSEKNYKVGDSLSLGALIKRITKDGLLVERDGVIESIALPKNKLDFEPVSKPLIKEKDL